MKTWLKRWLTSLVIAATLIPSPATPLHGQPVQPAERPQAGTLEPARLARWVDAYFRRTMDRTRVPGAVLVVVDHGRVVLMRGYGVRTPGGPRMDPERTLVRIGSISKVFTALAASDMIERGMIDPRRDVNDYLANLRVPARYDRPVTVADLLLHEGGFGAELRGMEAPTDARAQLPPAEVQRRLVSRVRAPGRYPAYDNNGWGLLGLVLGDVAHRSYRDLIAERLFRPLGMTRSVVGLPDARRGEAARDHHILPDGNVLPVEWSLLTPAEQGAGDISSTGSDMARLMIALLQRGRIDGRQAISPSVHAAVTDVGAHRLHPSLPGYARAIYEDRPAGRFALRHDGGMSGSAASMVLYPNSQVGVFFAINGRPPNPFDGASLSGLAHGISVYLNASQARVPFEEFLKYLEFHKAFAAAFLPPGSPAPLPSGRLWTGSDLSSLAGTYVSTGSPAGSFIGNFQVTLIEGRPVAVRGRDGLQIGGQAYRQIAPGLFENIASHERLAFVREGGETFLGESWLWRQRRLPAWQSPLVLIAPLLLFPLLLLTGLFYIRRTSPRRRLGLAAALLGLAFGAGWLLEGEYAIALFLQNRMLPILLWRALLAAATLGLLLWPVFAVRNWNRNRPQGRIRRLAVPVHLTMLGLAAWSLVALAVYWKLIWGGQ